MSMKRKSMFKKIIEKIYLSFSDNLVYLDSVTGCRTIFYFDKVLRKKFNIPEETIDKLNSIGNPNPLASEELKNVIE